MASVSLKSISKSYSPQSTVLDNVSLEIINREFLVLLGPSGCGKSTLLRTIAGIEPIAQGEIYIGGTCVNDLEPKDREVAMVFQSYALYPHMTVYDNMAYGLKIKKYSKPEIKARITEAASMLQIDALLKRYPSELSGGQKQRVAIGRAIVKEPNVFLMDEPLSNLDAKLRNETRLEIKKLFQKLKTTFIYVTHDQVEAVTLGDRIAVMNKGKIEQLGTPYDILSNPVNTFVAGFIGTPSINFVNARFGASDVAMLGDVGFKLSSAVTDRSGGLIVGIRPEHCQLAEKCPESLEMDIEFCEPIGTDMLLHLLFQDEHFVVKTPFVSGWKPEGKVYVKPDLDKMLFFNAVSTLNLKVGCYGYIN